jgi:hypothetical protein
MNRQQTEKLTFVKPIFDPLALGIARHYGYVTASFYRQADKKPGLKLV